MNGVLLVHVALRSGCNDFVVFSIEVPVPLVVLVAFEKDEIHDYL